MNLVRCWSGCCSCKSYRGVPRTSGGTSMSGMVFYSFIISWMSSYLSICVARLYWVLYIVVEIIVSLLYWLCISYDEQYYLKTGTCKFGASCKFHHPKHGGGSLSQAPLNIYGYPLRPVWFFSTFSSLI